MARRSVRVNPSTLHRQLQGEGVLLQLDTGEYFGLDDVGERFWSLLVECGDLEVVETRLLEEFDVDRATLSRDLETLVDDLVQRQLVDLAATDSARPSS